MKEDVTSVPLDVKVNLVFPLTCLKVNSSCRIELKFSSGIPAPYTRWTFLTYICSKNSSVCLKKPKINDKRGRGWPKFF